MSCCPKTRHLDNNTYTLLVYYTLKYKYTNKLNKRRDILMSCCPNNNTYTLLVYYTLKYKIYKLIQQKTRHLDNNTYTLLVYYTLKYKYTNKLNKRRDILMSCCPKTRHLDNNTYTLYWSTIHSNTNIQTNSTKDETS